MRGDVVFRGYGVHEGRAKDMFFGAFRSHREAEAQVAKLRAREMHGENWAARYHDRGFVIREHAVSTDFELPSRPRPRDKYFVQASAKPNAPGTWDSTLVEVFRRREHTEVERVCSFERDYALLQTFEPFRQGSRELALVSLHYTRTAVLDLDSGQVIAEEHEESPGGGFCPVGFYVPDWWDVHDGSVIPGSEYWSDDNEWPIGDFGFVWGCFWGDDSSWKAQYLDLRRVQDGTITRDDRFGYVPLATGSYLSPSLLSAADGAGAGAPSRTPDFIEVTRRSGVSRARFAVELDVELSNGRFDERQLDGLNKRSSTFGL
jgi:hypothetical protein